MFKSTGIIKYDPYRPGIQSKWWCVANVDREITRYYRSIVKTHLYVDLCPPSWDAHISILRGECPSEDKKHLWNKYNNQEITFEYDLNVKQAHKDEFWIVDIYCPLLKQIRNEFGFKSDWNQHLTIGRTWKQNT